MASAPDSESDVELVSVLVTGEEGLFLLARSVLDAQGIEYLVRGDNTSDQFSGGRVGSVFNLVTGPAELLVRPEDASRAADLLRDLEQASAPPVFASPSRTRSGRPQPGEYPAYAAPDIERVEGDDAVDALRAQGDALQALFDPLDDALVGGITYADGKWTMKQVLGHLCDDERIYAYRLLCIARGDTRPLAGFDEEAYMRDAAFEARPLGNLIDEYRTVRQATISLLEGLPDDAWLRRGTADGHPVSVRGLAFHIGGHELRHLRMLRDRYLPLVG